MANIHALLDDLNLINDRIDGLVTGFQGAITIADTPTADGVYIPTEAGVYPNAGGLEYAPEGDDEGVLVMFINNGSEWVKSSYALPKQDLSGLPTKEDVGIIIIPAGANILQSVASSNINDELFWQDGFLNNSGVLTASSTYRTTRDFQKAYPGTYDCRLFYSGNARLVAYDDSFSPIATLPNPTSPLTYLFNITLPEGTSWVKVSHLLSQNHTQIYADTVTEIDVITDEVFATPASVEMVAKGVIGKFGFNEIPIGTNLLDDLSNSLLTDGAVWADGFFGPLGNIILSANWYHTVKRYVVYPGVFRLRNYLRGNASVLIFDEGMNIIMVIQTSVGSFFNADVILPENSRYIALSYEGTQENVSNIALLSTSAIYPSNSKTESAISESNSNSPVNGLAVARFTKDIWKRINVPKSKMPIATFISDDGHIDNEWFVELLNSKGIKGTFVIITGRPNVDDSFMTWETLKEMADNGHEIGGHTHTHPYLGEITPEEVEREISRCRAELLSRGHTSQSFASPYSSVNPDVSRTIRKYFNVDWRTVPSSAIALGECCNSSPVRSFQLNRVSFDAGQNGVSTLINCKAAVDVAFAKKEWLGFAIHPQYGEYHQQQNPSGFLQRRQDLSDLIDYILLKQIQILTTRDALQIWGNPVSIGDVGLDSKYYTLGMDGNDEGNYFD